MWRNEPFSMIYTIRRLTHDFHSQGIPTFFEKEPVDNPNLWNIWLSIYQLPNFKWGIVIVHKTQLQKNGRFFTSTGFRISSIQSKVAPSSCLQRQHHSPGNHNGIEQLRFKRVLKAYHFRIYRFERASATQQSLPKTRQLENLNMLRLTNTNPWITVKKRQVQVVESSFPHRIHGSGNYI